MKLLLVLNPISGDIDKKPFLEKAKALCTKYGIDLSIYKTDGVNDREELKAVIERLQPDKVAVAGGDGTTLLTGLLLKGSSIPMGIIPMGSANGMAIELGVMEEPIEALKDLIMSSMVRGLDMLVINGEHYMVHIGDVGINARIIEQSEKEPNRGMTTYLKHFIKEIGQPEAFDIEIEVGGDVSRFKGVMVAFCNARKYGTEMPITAKGNPMDGVFEIVVIEEITVNALLQASLARWSGFPFKDPDEHQVIRTQEATVRFQSPRLLQVDGEIIGEVEEVDLKIIPGAIQLLTTTNNPYIHRLKESR